MKKLWPALIGTLLVTCLTSVSVASAAGASEHAIKKSAKKKSKAKKAPPPAFEKAAADDDDTGLPIDTDKVPAIEYKCELGNTVTIFRNEGDENYIALRWQKIITRMKRVGTTTGANRFENKKSGLVWIGIPAKGILLDAKHGHQLANECKDAVQAMPIPVPTPNPTAEQPKKS